MNRFHLIDDGAAILRHRGVWKQANVYRRGTHVFAGFGGGFIRLLRGSATSNPNVSWDDIEADGVVWPGPSTEPLWDGEAG